VFQPLVEVLSELRIRPVEISNEGLERVQLPKQILRGGAPVAKEINIRIHNLFSMRKRH
jgi:hypothetical protein